MQLRDLRVLLLSDSPYEGQYGPIQFVRLESNEQIAAIVKEATDWLKDSGIVMLQNNAGNGIGGGPVPAEEVVRLMPFDIIPGISPAERFIVFETSETEAQGTNRQVIPLHEITRDDFGRLQQLPMEHPLQRIIRTGLEYMVRLEHAAHAS